MGNQEEGLKKQLKMQLKEEEEEEEEEGKIERGIPQTSNLFSAAETRLKTF
jgi:hypothetical protein